MKKLMLKVVSHSITYELYDDGTLAWDSPRRGQMVALWRNRPATGELQWRYAGPDFSWTTLNDEFQQSYARMVANLIVGAAGAGDG